MRDPMPLPIPMMTRVEEEWERLRKERGGRKQIGEGKRLLRAAGRAAWIWLCVMIANYMYCGGRQWEGRLMRHREGLSPTQELMLEGFERRVGRFWGVENGLTPGGPLPVRWEPPNGSKAPRIGDLSDAGGSGGYEMERG